MRPGVGVTTPVRIAPDGPVLHTATLAVRIGDVNYARHLGHDALVTLLHEARIGFLRAFGFEEWDVEGRQTVVVDLAVRYRSESFAGDRLAIEVSAGEVASRRAELLYRVVAVDDGRVVAVAMTGLMFVEPTTGHVGELPPRLRDLLVGRVEV